MNINLISYKQPNKLCKERFQHLKACIHGTEQQCRLCWNLKGWIQFESFPQCDTIFHVTNNVVRLYKYFERGSNNLCWRADMSWWSCAPPPAHVLSWSLVTLRQLPITCFISNDVNTVINWLVLGAFTPTNYLDFLDILTLRLAFKHNWHPKYEIWCSQGVSCIPWILSKDVVLAVQVLLLFSESSHLIGWYSTYILLYLATWFITDHTWLYSII